MGEVNNLPDTFWRSEEASASALPPPVHVWRSLVLNSGVCEKHMKTIESARKFKFICGCETMSSELTRTLHIKLLTEAAVVNSLMDLDAGSVHGAKGLINAKQGGAAH